MNNRIFIILIIIFISYDLFNKINLREYFHNNKTINIYAYVKNPSNLYLDNLGDVFGYVLMDYLCKRMNINVKRFGKNDYIPNNTLAIVGSIIHLCINKVKNNNNNIIIAGCGIIKNDRIYNNLPKNIIFKGVRGPYTKKILNNNTNIISDPGLLISKIYKLPLYKNKYDIGYIIHRVDREIFFELFPEKKIHLIDNYTNYNNFINKLSQYKSVITSSLHGIIFCHSYNIPVCSIKVTNNIIGDNFKYLDYYHSIGNLQYTTRKKISKNTNFKNLIQNEWQPPKNIIKEIQNKQEKILISCIKEYSY